MSSLTIRELVNLFGFEVDEASFSQAENAVDKLEVVLFKATAAARGAAAGVSAMVENVSMVGRGASDLGAVNNMLSEWTRGTESAAIAAENQAKKAEAAARSSGTAAKEQVDLAKVAEASGTRAASGFRVWLNVLSDVNQTLQLVQAAAHAITAPVIELVARSRELNANATLLGVGLGPLQEWEYAISAVGGQADQLGESLLDLADKMDDAQQGQGEYAELFKRLGVNVKDAHTGKLKPLEAFLPELADAFTRVTNETERAGLASRLMGETGAKVLLPFFAKGSAGMAALSADARAMGAVLSDNTIKATLAFREELGRTDAVLQALKYELGAALLPAVRDILMAVREWIGENRALLASGFDVAMRLFAGAARVVVQVGEPLLRLFKLLVVDGGRWKLVLGALTLALLYYAGTAVMAAVGSTWSLVAAIGSKISAMRTSLLLFQLMTGELKLLTLWEGLAGAAGAAAPYLIATAWAALVIVLGLMLEDIYTFFRGGDSIIGRWGEWIGQALTVNETDNPLVKLLKYLGKTVFDVQGAFIMLGEAISGTWDWIVDAVKTRVDQVTSMIRTLFDFFLGAPARALASFLSGDIAGGLQQLRSNLSAENVGRLLNSVQEGTQGFKVVDFAPERYLGGSASPAAALAASVANSTNQSSVFSPIQQLVQHITVGANATPQDAAKASGDGAREAWQEMLRDASFTAGNG